MFRLACRRTAAVAATAAALLSASACGGDTVDPSPSDKATSPQGSTKILKDAECTTVPKSGEIARSGYDLHYTEGEMKVSVAPSGEAARCVQFAKSGPQDPNVPPDTLLFTFAGNRGEGAQLEFLAVDLAGGVLPWPRGATARTPGTPITATVGVSIGGVYYTSSTCSLKLQAVGKGTASGRFDCPKAYAQTANPLDPNDDVSYDETSAPPQSPKTATLSGLFEVER